jgi:hypothetical protein
VSDPVNPPTADVDGFAKLRIDVRDEAALLRQFEQQVPTGAILLQYAQYDFDHHARPAALTSALVRWREQSPERRLGIFVHEIWLPSLVRRREWLDYPFQWLLARKLFRAADQVYVNNRRSADKVSALRGRAPDALLPVFSNIGEPAIDPAEIRGRDHGRWVFFGSAGRILRSLRRFVSVVQSGALPKSAVSHVTVLGGKPNDEIRTLLTALDLSTDYRPDLPAAEASARLREASWSFLDYDDGLKDEPSLLFKSGVFAALLAHGVVPVLPEPCGAVAVDGERLTGLLTLADFSPAAPSTQTQAAHATAGLAWYLRFVSVRRHAAQLMNLSIPTI